MQAVGAPIQVAAAPGWTSNGGCFCAARRYYSIDGIKVDAKPQESFKFGQVQDNTPRVQQTLSEPEDSRTFLPE